MKGDETQMTQGDSDDSYSDHVLFMVTTSNYTNFDY